MNLNWKIKIEAILSSYPILSYQSPSSALNKILFNKIYLMVKDTQEPMKNIHECRAKSNHSLNCQDPMAVPKQRASHFSSLLFYDKKRELNTSDMWNAVVFFVCLFACFLSGPKKRNKVSSEKRKQKNCVRSRAGNG